MISIIKSSSLLLAGVGAATALSINLPGSLLRNLGLSDACQGAILGVAENQDASSCLNVPGLTAVFTLQSNFSAVPALNNWLQGVCRADPCTNDTINAISKNITTACQAEIAQTNVPQSTLQTVIQNVPIFYPTVRKIACLKSASNDTLCTTSALLNIQQFIGRPLTLNSAKETFPGIAAQGILPANLTCTGCILAAYDTFKADQPTLAANPTVQRVFSTQCGPEFLSESQPSDVVDGTGSAAPTTTISTDLSNKNGALGITSGTLSSIISSAMALLVLLV